MPATRTAPTNCEKSQYDDVVRDVQETEFRPRMLQSGIGAWELHLCGIRSLTSLISSPRSGLAATGSRASAGGYSVQYCDADHTAFVC